MTKWTAQPGQRDGVLFFFGTAMEEDMIRDSKDL